QRKAAEALAAARRIVELAPTMENLQRAGDKAALLGEGNVAAACFVRLGQLKDEESPNSGFPWYDRAYNLDPLNLEAVLQYARGLFSRGALAECIDVLHPAVTVLKSTHEVRELYAHALMAARRPVEAEPYAWELYEKDSRQLEEIASLVGVYLDIGEAESAVALARRIDERESRAGRQREFLTAMYEVGNRRTPARGFCEYLAALLNSANREHEYSQILLKLFTAYCADGEYARAGDTLDRAAELDPYEPGHAQRLQALRGHISPSAYNSIARRFQSAASSGEPTVAPAPVVEKQEQESEPTVLEDFILQAEIYLQYGMRSKAMERLERISKLFPGEEHNNEKLRHLYLSAGFTASSATGTAAAKKAAAAPAASGAASGKKQPAASAPPAAFEENAVDNFARVTEITRNIYRQATVQSVLFSAVNEIGRHFHASRCIAGLCTVGKPPSAALEYCAPGTKQSDVMSIVKLIALTQPLAANGPVSITQAKTAPELETARENIKALGIE